MQTTQDLLNRRAYTGPAALRWYLALQGFSDAGEQQAYLCVADAARDQPILDLGVGAGRTVPWLRGLSACYLGLDYLPDMVAAARSRFPGVDIQVGDARDLSRFDRGRFALVVFSFNGLDSLAHADRAQVLGEVHRVLRPGGVFWFSTLNQQGPAHRERPWRPRWPGRGQGLQRYPLVALRALLHLPGHTRNYLRMSRLHETGDGWTTSSLQAHDYGLLVHYTTLARQRQELLAAGFQPDPQVFGDDGASCDTGDDLRQVNWFQILARA